MKKNMYYQRPVIVTGIIFGVLIIGSILFSVLWNGGSKPSGKPAESSVQDFNPDTYSSSSSDSSARSGVTAGAVNYHTGIIKQFAEDLSTVTIGEIGTGAEITGTFSGGTDITNSFGKKTTAAMLRIGDMVDIGIGQDAVLASVRVSTSTWTYKGIFNLTIDPDLKKITISDTIYRYDDSLLILSNNEFVDMSQMSRLDVFDVCGIDNYIYLIKVASGHGVLKLQNIDAFLDGTLIIDDNEHHFITADSTEYTLSEGNHRVEITSGPLKVSETIRIDNRGTTNLDLLPYTPEPEKYCSVTFRIEPYGAMLSIDGQQRSYGDPVSLPYGDHEISVTMSSYKPYFGTLSVSTETTVFSIALSYDASSYTIPSGSDETADASGTSTYDPSAQAGSSSQSGATASQNGNASSQTDAAASQTGNDTTDISAGNSDGAEQGGSDSENSEDVSFSGSSGGILVTSTDKFLVISGSDGCAVFVEDKYQGILENGTLIIPKPLGTVHIRLTLEGYLTSSYTVTLEDDGENRFLELPAMIPAN